MTDNENKWALVTGASRGIGRQYAKVLASYGYSLLLVSNESCDEVSDFVHEKYSVQILSLCLNLALQSAADDIFHYTEDNNIDVEVLVNNAGIFYFDSMIGVDENRIESMIALHVLTPTRLCRIFGGKMKAKSHGYILNMGSASDLLPYPGISTYAATKAYIKNMSISLNYELRPFGVHVMGVRPGAVATGLYGVTGKMQKLGLRLGIIITPEKLARRAVAKLFSSKCAIFVPRLLTYGYVFVSRVPWFIMGPVIKHSSLYNFLRK